MTLSKPGLHGDLSPAGSSCQNHSRGAGGQAAGRLSHPLLSHHCLTFLLPPALPSFHDLARIWGMVGGGWGENQNQRFPEPGRRQNAVAVRNPDLPRFNGHRAEPVLLGQAARSWAPETKQRTSWIWCPLGRGSQGRGKQSRPQTRRSQCREMGCARKSTPPPQQGAQGAQWGAPHPALVRGAVAPPLPAHAGAKNVCRLNDRATTGLSPTGKSRSSSGLAHLRTPPRTTLLP